MEAAKPENAGRVFWYIAPTYAQGKDIIWNDPNMLFRFLPKELMKKKNENELWVELFNRAKIQIKGGDKPDSLLGQDPYGIVVDETQNQKMELYDRILKPILAANGGWIWFLGTPRIKDHFYHKFIYAQENPLKWQHYELDAEISGIIPREELEEIRKNTPIETYNQEYRAKFSDGEGLLFRNVRELGVHSMEEPKKGHSYSIGVDLARKSDFTVITVYDESQDKVVFIDRFNQVDWAFQEARIESVARKYTTDGKLSRLKIDSTGVGDPICQSLQTKSLWVQPIIFTNKLKAQMIENLRIKFDHKTIKLPDYQPLLNELEVIEQVKTAAGNFRISAPEGFHDDCVFSLALAVYQSRHVPVKFSAAKRKSVLSSKYETNSYVKRPTRSIYSLNHLG